MTIGLSSGYELASLGSLSGAGVTAAQEIVGNAVTFQLVASDISGSVVVRFEGSANGTDYGNLNGSTDTTITADGTYLYGLADFPVRFVRVRFVSGTGTVVSSVGCA